MISRKWIILIVSLFIIGAASGYLVKTQLIEKKVVYKTYKQSIYVVNPKCITNCSVVDFEKSYTDFSNRYIAEYNSNNELIYKEILERRYIKEITWNSR